MESVAVKALIDKIGKIINDRKGTGDLVHDDVLQTLMHMRPSDFDRLCPPPASRGYWTDDNEFCKRLACYVFGVSPETFDEMPAYYYPVVVSIISQNFINFMARAIPV